MRTAESRKHYTEVVSGMEYHYWHAPISAVLYVNNERKVWHLFTHQSDYLGHFDTKRALRQHIGAVRQEPLNGRVT